MNLVVAVTGADAVNRAGPQPLDVSRVDGLEIGVFQRVDCCRLNTRKNRPRSLCFEFERFAPQSGQTLHRELQWGAGQAEQRNRG